MIRIVGNGKIPEARAFDDVARALEGRFDEDIYLAAMWAPLVGEEIPDGAIVYNMEPLYDGCRSFSLGYLDTLHRCRVLDYDRRNVEFLHQQGIDSFYMPYGYVPPLSGVLSDKKHIDFLLVGSVNPRRMKIVTELRKSIDITWVTGAYGETLDYLVDSARVVLNIHFTESHPLEVVRINHALARGATVVTEYGWDESVDLKYFGSVYFSADGQFSTACKLALQKPIDCREKLMRMKTDSSAAARWLKEKELCLG